MELFATETDQRVSGYKNTQLAFLFLVTRWRGGIKGAQQPLQMHFAVESVSPLGKSLVLTLLCFALFKVSVRGFCCGSCRHQEQPHTLLPSEGKFGRFPFSFIKLGVSNRLPDKRKLFINSILTIPMP